MLGMCLKWPKLHKMSTKHFWRSQQNSAAASSWTRLSGWEDVEGLSIVIQVSRSPKIPNWFEKIHLHPLFCRNLHWSCRAKSVSSTHPVRSGCTSLTAHTGCKYRVLLKSYWETIGTSGDLDCIWWAVWNHFMLYYLSVIGAATLLFCEAPEMSGGLLHLTFHLHG